MAKLQPIQEAALDVIDFIYFYDVVSLSSFSSTGENEALHKHINTLIDSIIDARHFTGADAVIYKHFLLCGVEIGVTFNVECEVFSEHEMSEGDKRQAIRDLHEKAIDVLRIEIQKKGFKRYEYETDVLDILEKTSIEAMPNSICFSLVAKALSFDFEGCISAHIYRKLLDLEILKTEKKCTKNNYDYKTNEHVFLRAMLFIEFEIMRNKLFHQNDRPNIVVNYTANGMSEMTMEKEEEYLTKTLKFIRKAMQSELTNIYNYDLMSTSEVQDYLLNSNIHLCHNKMFAKKAVRWISLFGLWHLKYHETMGSSSSIYTVVDNYGTCSDIASCEMKNQYGLSIEAKSLFLHNKKYKRYFEFIKEVNQEFQNSPKQGFVNTCFTYYFYFHPKLSDNLLNIYDQFDHEIF